MAAVCIQHQIQSQRKESTRDEEGLGSDRHRLHIPSSYCTMPSYSILFPNDELLSQVTQWIRTNTLPATANPVFRRFRYVNGHLECDGKLVAPRSQVDRLLRQEYESELSLGKGVSNFFHLESQHYIGIRRSDYGAFLKVSQEAYQIRQTPSHRTNRHIVANYCNQLLSVDLLDSSGFPTHRFQYILVCVDVFSRKVWLEKSRHKSASEVITAFHALIQRGGISPDLLMRVAKAASSRESSRSSVTIQTSRSSSVDPTHLRQTQLWSE